MRLTVGEITEVLGMTNETIRYYVREGLVKPTKNPYNNYWEYSSEDVLVISDILFYRYLGISLKNIKRILDGLDLYEIGDIIDETKLEVLQKINELNVCLSNLIDWRNEYDVELEGIGKFIKTVMPTSLRLGKTLSEEEHIAHYLKGKIKIEQEDWCYVSLSFFCDIKKNPDVMYKYISLNKTSKTTENNLKHELIEEPAQICLSTQVYASDNIHDMIDPLINYANENNIKITGEIYGRERTNYYINGVRNCIYSVYAPIEK